MFSQPKKEEPAETQQLLTDKDMTFGTIQHLEKLFKDHSASDILKSEFNETLVSGWAENFEDWRSQFLVMKKY